MKDVDWKLKLSSRKFWALLAALVISVLIIFGADKSMQENIAAMIMAFGSVAVYIFSEAKVDASNKE